MKTIKSGKKLFLYFIQHKRLLIISGAILCLALAGATAYARYHHLSTSKATTTSSSTPTPAKKEPTPTEVALQATTETESPTPTPVTKTAPPQQAAATPSAPVKQSTAERRASLPMPAPPSFSVGHLTGGVACYTGVYAYSISNIAINLTNNTTAFPGFYWQVELSNGTILEQGGAHIPSGSTTLPNFPSTPNMPSSFKLIYNPPDGLSARFVITSPNYSASNWSTPVPTGSGKSCHASPDYVPQ